jgi:glycine cleavage system H protein
LSDFPDDRKYTKEHEWAKEDGGRILVGITDFAQDQLGDVVFVGLPEVGSEVTAGQPLGEVESTKSVSDIYSPVSGTVAEKNAEVETNPELVNTEPYGRGWLVAIDSGGGALDGLMSAADYQALVESEG